jgi:hypothetical protein
MSKSGPRLRGSGDAGDQLEKLWVLGLTDHGVRTGAGLVLDLVVEERNFLAVEPRFHDREHVWLRLL